MPNPVHAQGMLQVLDAHSEFAYFHKQHALSVLCGSYEPSAESIQRAMDEHAAADSHCQYDQEYGTAWSSVLAAWLQFSLAGSQHSQSAQMAYFVARRSWQTRDQHMQEQGTGLEPARQQAPEMGPLHA